MSTMACFGNSGAGTGSLVGYLSGQETFEMKMEMAGKIFFTQLSVAPQLKEQIVISWLTNILSCNKVLDYSVEERYLMWEIMRKFMCSERLKVLHSEHWTCTFTPEFIQTMLSTLADTTTGGDIKKEILLICDRIISLPSLSPQILILLDQSFALCNSILLFSRENGLPSSLYSLLKTVIQKCFIAAKHRMNSTEATAKLYDDMLFNLLEFKYVLVKATNSESEQLLHEIDNLTKVVFSSANESLYSSLLSLPTIEDSKVQLSSVGESFYGFLIHCISHKDKNAATCILKEFSTSFIKYYKGNDYIPCQYLINVMYLLGIHIKDWSPVESISIAAQSISPSLVGTICKEQFVAGILEALCQVSEDEAHTAWQLPLNSFLMALIKVLFTENQTNADILKCALLILKLNPEFATESTLLLDGLLNCNFKKNELESLYYKTLCKVLDIHIKLRSVDILFKRICLFLAEMKNPRKMTIRVLKVLFTYDRKQALESNYFMRKFLLAVKEMGLQMWISLWASIHEILSTVCHESLDREAENSSVQRASGIGLVVWFSSCCLSVMSVMSAISVYGMADKIAGMMNAMARDSICPLVEDMLGLEEGRNELFPPLMNLIFVWCELHISLLSTDTGYKDLTDYPVLLVSQNVDHFSAQAPFFNSEKWEQILANCYDETDDHSRFAVTQLMIQKLLILKLQDVEQQSQSLDTVNTSVVATSCLDSIFSEEDATSYPLSLSLVGFNLSLLIPSAEKSHMNVIARMLISGVQENSESWLLFGRSFSFQESKALQSCTFSMVCQTILSLLTGSKRKLEEDEEPDLNSENKTKHLSRKILRSLTKLQDITKKSDWEKHLQLCFSFITTLLNSNHKRARLSKRSESEVQDLLKVIDLFPVLSLQPNLLMGLFAFTLVVFVEEGGVNGRTELVSHALRILNRVLSSQHAFWVFKLTRLQPFNLLQWTTHELNKAFDHLLVEDCHLEIILKNDSPKDCLGELLYLLNTLTNIFLGWAKMGDKSCNYVETMAEESKSSENNDAILLAFLAFIVHQKKSFDNSDAVPLQNMVKAAEVVCARCLEIAKTVDLAKINNVTVCCCLVSFSFLLLVKERLNTSHKKALDQKQASKRKRDGTKVKASSDVTEEDTDSKDVTVKIDWEGIVQQGEQLADLALAIEASELKDLGFTFYLSLASAPNTATNLKSWKAFQKAWDMPRVGSTSIDRGFKSLFMNLAPKHYKQLLIKETSTETALTDQRLDHLISIIISDVPNSLVHTKKVAIEHVVSVLCIEISSPHFCRENSSLVIRVMEIFLSALMLKNVLTHSKALILNACDKIEFEDLSTPSFLKVFDSSSKIVYFMLTKDYAFVAKRTASVMSLFTGLVLEVMRRSVEEDRLHETQVKELSACCNVLELTVPHIKRNYCDFTRVVPFSLSKMVEKMQEYALKPLIKESVQRIIYALLDVSDEYCLRHLMVSLRPATSSLLKHIHSTFSKNYKFDPRT